MKTLQLFILSFLVINISQAEIISLEIARETLSIKIEYIESSNRGLVHPKGCSLCTKDFYKFSKPPIINKKGKVISFDEFLADYWNAEYPTLFLDPKSLSVLRINY